MAPQPLEYYIKMNKEDPTAFYNFAKAHIEELTEVTNNHYLTPEITLRLITPNIPSWNYKLEDLPFDDPYWAFYWLGGQGLTRYIMDNEHIIKGKTILDLGSGCGALSIAIAKMDVAADITANDIDPVSIVALKLNAELNGITNLKKIKVVTDDLAKWEAPVYKYDCILVGDTFIDARLNYHLMKWLIQAVRRKVEVYIGDPGRGTAKNTFHEHKDRLEKVHEYEIPLEDLKLNQLKNGKLNIWKLHNV